MELKLGKMTSQEIANWFNVSYNSYRRDKKRYLNILQDYCQYEEVYGGIIIKEIFIKIYDKKLSKKVDKLFLKEIVTANDQLSTISGIARKYKNEFENLNDSAIRKQLTKSRNKLFGEAVKQSGIMGSRDYVWAIKISDLNQYRFLTEEENKIFDALILAVYGNTDTEKIKGLMLLDKVFKETDMTKEEYLAIKEDKGYNFFESIISNFNAITGNQIVNVNKYELENNLTLNDQDRAYKIVLEKEIF